MLMRNNRKVIENFKPRRIHGTGFIQIIATIFEDFSRTTFDFQGPPARNVISYIVKKYTFSFHSNRPGL